MSDQLISELGPKPNEELRAGLRERAKRSAFFMGKLIGFRDLDPDLHGMMAEWIQRPTNRKLGLAPRAHLKTSVWTQADSIRRIACDPNIRILIINETATNSRNWLNFIKGVWEKNEVFQWLFPELIPDYNNVRWSQDQMEIPRERDYPEATIEVVGVGGASTSRHYNIIKEDDLVGREASESKLVMSKAIDQHKLAESLLNSPSDEIHTVGTRWGPFDLVQWMYDNEPNVDHLRLELDKPDGGRLWPSRFPDSYVEELKRKYGPAMFALQYQNKAITVGVTDFREEWLRYYRTEPIYDERGRQIDTLYRLEQGARVEEVKLSEMERVTICDPCLSAEKGTARSALVTLGLTPSEPFNVVVLSAIARKLAPNATIDLANEEWLRWKPYAVCIEVVAGQIAFFYWIPERHPEMPVRKLKTDTSRSKMTRIRTLASYFEQGRVFLQRGMTDFLEEYLTFPSGQTVDLLDAMAYGPQVWAPPGPRARRNDEWDEDDEPMELIEQRFDGRSPLTGY